MGWVNRRRDLGQLIFIDLRDRTGVTQVVVSKEASQSIHEKTEQLRNEYVIAATGTVKLRDANTINKNIPTGEVELVVEDVRLLNEAKQPPFLPSDTVLANEEMRLKYRYLDLRRDAMQHNIELRHKVALAIRENLSSNGFFEIETPFMTRSTPEGARDYLVPSRVQPGSFYALPQSPQLFKQILMISGFDRYFQIAPCFRDEDPRADRLPGEFYQLDVEMSFVEQGDVFAAMEPVMTGVLEEFANGKPVTKGWPRIPYDEAIRKYGSDKPDLRNPIEMQDVTEHFRGSGFKVFAGMLDMNQNARVWAIPAKGGGSRAVCDRMNAWAQSEGQPGLGYIFFREGEGAGPIAKNIGPERTEAIRKQLGLSDGDAVFFVAGLPNEMAPFAGQARVKIGNELELTAKDQFAFCWIVDFPMYEWNEEEGRIDFSHNPFSMPQGGLEALESKDPLDILAYQYDIVCNGVELSSGAIRNHKPEIMEKAFAIAGYPHEELEKRFGGMLRALQYGAPPHGGIAPGIDRIVMLLCGEENLRQVVMFPMNQQAEDLLMGAPSEVTPKQLKELHIKLDLPKAKA